MDFWRTVMVLFRRWYITLPAFVATLVAASAASSAVPIQYQSTSVLVLTTPLTGGTESTQPTHPNPLTNPLLNFDQSLALTASIVIQQLNSPETAATLGVTPAGSTNYEVNNGSTNPELLQSGPEIFVVGEGPGARAAQEMAEKVSNLAADILAERQDELNAPESTHIEIQQVVPPTPGKPLTGSPLRAAAAVGALAGLMSLAAVYGFESLMTHRRRRRAEKQRAAENDDPFSLTEDGFVDRLGQKRISVRTQRWTHPEPQGSARRTNGTAPAGTGHRVNGTSGAVGVLESGGPGDSAAHDPAADER